MICVIVLIEAVYINKNTIETIIQLIILKYIHQGDVYENIILPIDYFLDTAQENDTNYNIALFMANNFYRIANMRISELAVNVLFHRPTISRFVAP